MTNPRPLLDVLAEHVEEVKASRTSSRHSKCSTCSTDITITITGDQKWQDAHWFHDEGGHPHLPVPEARIAVDATCPACGYPEIGFAIAREEFTCSRCRHAQPDRPED